MNLILKNIDISKPLAKQKKPDYVCEPGDPRIRKYGWTKANFRGYISIDPDGENGTIYISAIESRNKGKGNFSRLIHALHRAGFRIKVPSPFERMEAICKHLGFKRTEEYFPEICKTIPVWILPKWGDDN